MHYSRHIITYTSWTYLYTELTCTRIYISVALFVTTFIAFINFIYFEGERDLPHMTVTGPVQSLHIATKLQLPNEILNKEERFWLTS